MTDKKHQIMFMSRAELELFFYNIIKARDHDWQTDHNRVRKPWDLAKDWVAICLEDHFNLVKTEDGYDYYQCGISSGNDSHQDLRSTYTRRMGNDEVRTDWSQPDQP